MEPPINTSPELKAYCGSFADETQLLGGLEGEPAKLVELVKAALQDDKWKASHQDLMGKFLVLIQTGEKGGTIDSSIAQELTNRINSTSLKLLRSLNCDAISELKLPPLLTDNLSQLSQFFIEEMKREEAKQKIKIAAHVLGFQGNYQMGQETVKLEGADPAVMNQHLFKVYTVFAEENPLIREKLSPENIEDIKQAFCNASRKKQVTNPDEVFNAVKAGNSSIILGGTAGHAVNIVFCKDKVIICNRGQGATGTADGKVKAGVVYDCKADSLDKQTVERLLIEYPGIEEFAAAIDSLFGKVKLDDLGFTKKEQKVGNCTWASAKTSLYALLLNKCDSKSADQIYKSFSTYARKLAIEELRNNPYVSKELLEFAEKKYQQKGEGKA